jgi:hypothetical protein
MALTTFNLAALPVKFIAVPMLVGLAAGTGAFAAYVRGPAASQTSQAEAPAVIVAALPAISRAPVTTEAERAGPAKPGKKLSCEEQTWPYLENRCIVRKGTEPARDIRFVMAPREDDRGPSSVTAPQLVTSDGVLRGPGVAPEADSPVVKPATPTVKKAAKRSDLRRQPQGGDEFRRSYSVYTVPAANSTKPVIVVRPLRLNTYSSRF